MIDPSSAYTMLERCVDAPILVEWIYNQEYFLNFYVQIIQYSMFSYWFRWIYQSKTSKVVHDVIVVILGTRLLHELSKALPQFVKQIKNHRRVGVWWGLPFKDSNKTVYVCVELVTLVTSPHNYMLWQGTWTQNEWALSTCLQTLFYD